VKEGLSSSSRSDDEACSRSTPSPWRPSSIAGVHNTQHAVGCTSPPPHHPPPTLLRKSRSGDTTP
jgi:hypothetical protein